MKLFSYWRSSCSWRVRIALAYKNIPHTLVPVHLVQGGGEQHGAEHVARNPSAQVPVLEIEANGVTQHLGQSLPILEYLEECHPHPALLPADPSLRARARQMAELVNSGIQPLQNLSVLQRLKNVHSVDEGPCPSTISRCASRLTSDWNSCWPWMSISSSPSARTACAGWAWPLTY